MSTSAFLLTHSRGIQEEATAPNIRKKCFVLRTSTERQEAVDAGYAELVGVRPGKVLNAVNRWWDAGAKVPRRKSPFGDGKAAEKMARILAKEGFY